MFCSNCGVENDDDARFCTGCGRMLESVEEKETASGVTGRKTGPLPKAAMIGAGFVIAALVAVICIVVNFKWTVDLDEYITIDVVGYDGYGRAQVSVDWDAIEKKYDDRISFTREAKSGHNKQFRDMTPVEIMEECVSIRLEPSGKLSNGDTVSYIWNIDEDLYSYLKCKVKFTDGTYDVADLRDVGTFDAFDGLQVSFSGLAPNGSISMNFIGARMEDEDFVCNKTSGLRNGDVVTVTISNKDVSSYAERFGAVPETFQKDFEVSGLDEYVENYADLTDDFRNELKSQAEDAVYAYIADDPLFLLHDLNYSGYIMNDLKNGSDYVSSYNDLYMIYSGTVSSPEGYFSAAKVYFPVRFSNILNSSNRLSYDNNYEIVGYSYLEGSFYSIKGYDNPITCYMDIAEANKGLYYIECGDGFEVYSENGRIESLDDISGEYKEELYADARDKIEAYIASAYKGKNVASDLSFAGEYLLIAKEQGMDFEKNNKYIVVFSAIASNTEDYNAKTVYFPVEYDGIVKLPGNEYMITASKDILGYTKLSERLKLVTFSTKGYADGTVMYSEIVTADRADYTYEVSAGLKEFGE